MSTAGLLAFAALLVLPCQAFASGADCAGLGGSISVELSTDTGYEGLYKYCISLSWTDDHADVDDALAASIAVDLLANCPCACDEGTILFDNPGAGSGSGSDDDGTCEFAGEYSCGGTSSSPGPKVVFSLVAGDDCDLDDTGAGSFCFYSPLAPGPSGVHVVTFSDDEDDDDADGLNDDIDEDDETCQGTLAGSLPECKCVTPVDGSTWGSIKGMYRR